MSKWMIAAKRADFNAIAERYNISPVMARIIRNRDIVSDEEINKFLNGDENSILNIKRMIKSAGTSIERFMDLLEVANDEKVYLA